MKPIGWTRAKMIATLAELERREAEVLRGALQTTTTCGEGVAGCLEEWIKRKESRIRAISEWATNACVELAPESSALQNMPVDPRLVDRDWDEAALLGAYAALAKAVVERSRAFRLLTYVAAEATEPETKTLAESLAREQLTETAHLRAARRLAWRGEEKQMTLWRVFLTAFDDPVIAADLMRAIGMRAADEIARSAYDASARPAEATKLLEAAETLRAGGVSTYALTQQINDAVFNPLTGKTPIIRARQLSQRLFEICDGVGKHASDDEIMRLAQQGAANAIVAIKILGAIGEES
jgi:hypothetical protein